jgi:opacity protein-like surface antigen
VKRVIVRAAVLAVTLSATHVAAARAQLRLKGGVSFSDVTNTGALPGTPKQRSGFTVGLGLEPRGMVGLGVEGLWARRGLDNSNTIYARETDYLDIPTYLRVQLPIPSFAPFAYAGPQWSYELKCTSNSADCPPTDKSKWTYAGVIGAGLRLTGGLSLEGRYMYGLSDLKYSTLTTSANYKTRSFLILAGIGF